MGGRIGFSSYAFGGPGGVCRVDCTGSMLGPPISSASDSGVIRPAVIGPTLTPCIPGAVIQPGWVLRCDNGVSGTQIPGTVVSLYPFGGCSLGSEYAISLGSA